VALMTNPRETPRWTVGPEPYVVVGLCGAWGLDGCSRTRMTVKIKETLPVRGGFITRERWFCGEACREAWEASA